MARDRNQAKAARLNRLSLLLRSRSYSLDELAQEFGRDRRTIQRDLADLRELLGCSLEPRNGHYQLDSEGYLPPPPLSLEELWALFLACRTLEKRGTFPRAARSALEKLRGSARAIDRRTLQELDRAVGVAPSRDDRASEFLRLTLQAYDKRRSIQIVYRGLERAEPEARRFDPWGVVLRQDEWYVVGYDHLRAARRTLKLSRAISVTPTDLTYELPDGFDPGSALFHNFDVGDDPARRVRLKVPAELARLLEENPGHPSQTIQGQIVELQVKAPLRMIRWLLGLTGIEVLEPPELRQALAAEAEAIAARHR